MAVVLRSTVAVDCRIEVRDQNNVRTLNVAGRLAAENIPELMIVSGEISTALRVDLTELISIDVIALTALQHIRDAGARLVGAPKYIQIKLDSPAPDWREP